jgi:hypothetical protein
MCVLPVLNAQRPPVAPAPQFEEHAVLEIVSDKNRRCEP